MPTGNVLLLGKNADIRLATGFITVSAGIDGGLAWPSLTYDPDTDEEATWSFPIPTNFASAFVAEVFYDLASVQSGVKKIEFNLSIMAMTPGTDTGMETASFDTANNSIITLASDQAADDPLVESTALTNDDSAAAEDLMILRLQRNGTDATNDTATGDVRVPSILLKYTTI